MTYRKIFKYAIFMFFIKGLVVVHTEDDYLEDGTEEYPMYELFDRIGVEIGRRIEAGDNVYYLSGGENVYSSVNEFVPQMRVISNYGGLGNWSEKQFSRTKEIIMNDGLEEIVISGVAYDCCVTELCNLFCGTLISPMICMSDYVNASKELGWTPGKFVDIFCTKLNARVDEDLTSKRIFDSLNLIK